MSQSTASMPRARWMGVGQSGLPGAGEAGRAAAEQALQGRPAALVIVFSSDSYDLPALLAGINAASGDAPLVGCSTSGEIASSGPSDSSVVVVALGGSGFRAQTAVAENVSTRLRDAGAEVASCLVPDDALEHQVLLLLTDGLAGDQQEIVRGAYGVLGAAVPLVGGCAGDDLRMTATAQFHGSRVYGDAVVGAGLSSDSPLGIGVRHGWQTVGEPMLVTRSASNRVYTLDDRPALDVYLERLSPPAEAHHDPAAFTRFAMTHPLGLRRRSGEPQVRFVADANFADRSIGCIAEVPQGGITWLMQGDDESVLEATDAACRDALDALGGVAPLGLIAFDCIARRGVLGDVGIKTEIDRIASAADAPVAGFYTYGEIARTGGISGFHNQTLVVLAVS